MSKTIKHTIFYTHAPEVIWDYLTKPELIEQWLMKTDLKPVVGYDFQFQTRPLPQFDFDGIAYCKMLEVQPYTRLSYSWKGGPGEGRISLDSIVVWTLNAVEGGTELHIEHSGFKEVNFNIFAAMDGGWLKNMQRIDALIKNLPHDSACA